MGGRLRDLIRAVRACKTAAEERDVIAKESAALREAFRSQDQSFRHRNVAKLMYIHMLGYPTHFGQMETLKLIAANGFPEKRMGYLGLMILLDERQEVLMLVTNSIKMDLNNHKNQYTVGLALAAMGNICSAEMARDLAPDVERLLESSNPYVRKKAALCCIRVLKKNPELIEVFWEKAGELLHDKNQGVCLAGVTLMLAICALDPSTIPKYRPMVPLLCKMLRGLLQSGFSPEHDVAGITDPFLQVKLLQLLRVLGAGDADASDAMTDVLAQVAANTEGARNAGNAILYEAVNTIMGIETIGGLRVMAVNILGRFLANRDNNIRYVALNTLSKVVSVDTAAVQRHRATIVDCVKDADVSIRRRALELVYALVNEANIRPLTRELLDYLAVCDAEFKPDLTAKVALLIQRYAPDKRWHIDNTLAVLVQAGAHVKDSVVRCLIVLIANAPELQAYAARAFGRALDAAGPAASPALLQAGMWVIGEFGETLAAGAPIQLQDGEPPFSMSESAVVGLVEAILAQSKPGLGVREFALTAAMKLTARMPAQVARLRALVVKYQASVGLEVQQRSCEFGRIFEHEAIRPPLLERMPAPDEAEYFRVYGGGPATPLAAGSATAGVAAGDELDAGGGAAASSGGAGGGDLVDLLGGVEPAAAAVTSTSTGGALEDLLGGAAAPSTFAAGAGGLLDLLGTSTPTAAPAAAQAPADMLGDLLGSSPPKVGQVPITGDKFPPITAWQADGLSISFSFVKPVPAEPALTTIQATISNAGLEAINGFNLQAAVPKFMALRLEPPSGTALPPGGSIVQVMHINNSAHGNKPLAMRLRLSWSSGGQPVVQQAEVANFPNGL